MKPRTVLAMEQALSMTYATSRFVQLGWRVIRLESTPYGKALPGDPNRYVGKVVADEDRRSYFIAPNVGKEAIALNLKEAEGRDLVKRIIREFDVDVFCCNTLPSRYESFGIDYDTLKAVKPDIIWAAISAMGPDHPNTPGYDPAIQAMAGFMEITGHSDGPPTLAGTPLVDLKAGDEVYAGVLLALAEKAESGKGKAFHVSMLQAAASWLITTLPLLDFDCDPLEVTRCGNEHRKFLPVNAYPTRDGYIYVAIGNDIQWQRLVDLDPFEALDIKDRRTNTGRLQDREAINRDMEAVIAKRTTAEWSKVFADARIPHAPIHTIYQVRDMEALASKLPTTRTPDGKVIHLSPPGTDMGGAVRDYPFPPKYSQDTEAVLTAVGLSGGDIAGLRERGIIP